MVVLVIDNYDSFTYNLVQYLEELGGRTRVFRNDVITVDQAERLGPDRIVISPGPRGPDDAGVSVAMVRRFADRAPILGVCLGHQVVAQAFGARIARGDRVVHGKTSPISHDGRSVYRGLPSPFEAGRYHSLVVEERSLPDCLEVSARAPTGEIMGLRHRVRPIDGLQFHPESILTPLGKALLRNFLDPTIRCG